MAIITSAGGSHECSSSSCDSSNFQKIPFDAFENIALFLDGISLMRAACVCKQWYTHCSIIICNRKLHEPLCKRALTQKADEYQLNLNRGIYSGVIYAENYRLLLRSLFMITHLDKLNHIDSVNIPFTAQQSNECNVATHIFGGMLVVICEERILVYDLETTARFYCGILPQQKSHRDSFVIPKQSTCKCDILVVICGTQRLRTHVFLFTPSSLINKPLDPYQRIITDDQSMLYHTEVIANGPKDLNDHIITKPSYLYDELITGRRPLRIISTTARQVIWVENSSSSPSSLLYESIEIGEDQPITVEFPEQSLDGFDLHLQSSLEPCKNLKTFVQYTNLRFLNSTHRTVYYGNSAYLVVILTGRELKQARNFQLILSTFSLDDD